MIGWLLLLDKITQGLQLTPLIECFRGRFTGIAGTGAGEQYLAPAFSVEATDDQIGNLPFSSAVEITVAIGELTAHGLALHASVYTLTR
jgi:hypothetical protein